MKTCTICGQPIKFLPKKILDGQICSECASLLPKSIQLKNTDSDYLKNIIEKNQKKKEIFNSTASYGNCYIDSIHGLFCISSRRNGDEPAEFGDIYSVEELEEVGLFCTDVRNIGSQNNYVVCNVKIRFKTSSTSGEALVASKETCPFSVSGKSLEWQEPSKLGVFRALFNQMIDNVAFGLLKKLDAIQEMNQKLTAGDKTQQWAKGVMFVPQDEEIELDELKKRRNELIKIYHPDLGGDFANTEITAQVNEAYNILSKK